MFDLAELERAHEIVGQAVPPTPAHAWPLLAQRLGTDVVVKHENHTPIGAFKVRGGLVYLDRLKRRAAEHRPASSPPRAAITGRASPSRPAATACRRRSTCRAAIRSRRTARCARSAPSWSSMARISRRRAEEAAAPRRSRGLHMVPSFHPDLVLGVATYALELLRAAPDLDVLYVPIGQGSGICGCIMARDLLGLKTEIVGVQSTEAPSYALSFAAGTVVTHRDQQHAGRRHGDPRSRCRGARDHPQGRLAHRAGHRRRDRRRRSAPTGPTRTISPKAPAPPRWPRRCRRRQNSPASASA